MMRIDTIESEEVPLMLGRTAVLNAALPSAVELYIRRGQWRHLVAWSDENSNTLGLWYRAASIVLPANRIWGFDIELMEPARGSGWIRLDAALDGKRGGANMLDGYYELRAEKWLLEKRSQLSAIFSHRIDVNRLGADC